MQKRPFALLAVLAGIAVGLFFLWRGLGAGTGGTPPAPTSAENRSEGAEKPSTPSRLETATAPEEDGARADAARSAAELAARTETFPLADASWIQGTVRFPKDSPADETLQAWAFEDSAARGLPRSVGDLPDHVRTGKLEKGWWSRRPIDASGAFKLPIPKGATAASVVVDGRFLFLSKSGHADLANGNEPLALEPELGAWLVGRCTLPSSAKAEDAPAGEPVAFAAVNMSPSSEDPGSRSTLVDGDLAFELRGVPARGVSWLSIAPKRLVAVFRSDLGLVPGKRCEVEIALTLGGRASGRVVDDSGAGLAGARVETQPERGSSGFFPGRGQSDRGSTTGADGSFELFGIRPGKARISAQEDGYVEASTESLAFVDGDVKRDLSITLSRGNHVAGVVTWPDGSPAVGAAVQALEKISSEEPPRGRRRPYAFGQFLPKSGKTGEKGEFSISGLGPGPFEVSAVAHRGIADRLIVDKLVGRKNEPGENLPSWTVELTGVSANAEDLALVLREPVGLAGRVVDDQGAPVKKFAITASPAREDDGTGGLAAQIALKTTTFEAEDGSFFLNGLQPGKWKIAAEAKGFVQIDEPTVDVPRAEGSLVVALTRAASAAGTVVDPDGRPVAGAEVSQGNGESSRRYGLREHVESVKADAQGAFAIEGLPPGAIQLVAKSETFARSDPASLELQAGQALEGVVLHLHLGGNLTGEVFDAHGAHAVGRKIMVMSMGAEDQREATVDDAGLFAIEHLTPGAYQVIAEPTQSEQESMIAKGVNGGEMDPSEVFASLKMASAQVKEGETAHVVLGAPPKSPVRLFGTVTRGGEAVSSGTVMCIGEGGSLLSKLKMGKVRANGDYEIKLDEPGAVVLSYQRELSGVGAGEFHVTVPEATEFRLDLEVPTGGLRGFVRGPDGSPLAGISIQLLRPGGLSSISSMDRGGSETSDANGRFEFGELAAGTYGLAAGGGGEVSGDSKSVPWGRAIVSGLRVESNRFHEGIEIRLTKPGSISGLVRNADGNPVSGATVFACDEHGEIVHRFSEVATDARGSFTYRGLAPGRYVLCARTKTLASNESAAISVHEGETAQVELAAGPGTTLVASVEDKDGATLHANFSVRDEHGHDVTEMYDLSSVEGLLTQGLSSTESRIGPLPPGEYKVTAIAFDGRTASKSIHLRGQDERGIKLRIE